MIMYGESSGKMQCRTDNRMIKYGDEQVGNVFHPRTSRDRLIPPTPPYEGGEVRVDAELLVGREICAQMITYGRNLRNLGRLAGCRDEQVWSRVPEHVPTIVSERLRRPSLPNGD
jgi:hypothetical protein